MTEQGDQQDVCQPLPGPPPGGEGDERRRVVGCMTGTSLDGLDCALVEIAGRGLSMRATFVRGNSMDLGALKPRLRAIADQVPVTAGEVAGVMRDFAVLHADAVRNLLAGEACDLVCVHGQTVFHKPPLSWQLFQPAPLVRALQVPVVYDLRQADLALGGQGAPITPIADWILFRRIHDPMIVVNLGGFANYTQWFTALFPDEDHGSHIGWPARPLDIRGGDICACNQLLDQLARERLGRSFDEDGRVAASGVADPAVVRSLVALLENQARTGRSLGTGDELHKWTDGVVNLPAPTVLRSACDAIGNTIAQRAFDLPVLLAGGGVRNAALVGAVRAACRFPVTTTDTVGIPAEFREAVCFAVLGALCQDRVPITLPQVTKLPAGVAAPLSGVWAFP